MKILSLDSSTEAASCAILEDNKLLGEITFNFEKQHSVIIMSIIENLLTNLHLDIKDIDGFVIAKGPGSFTGLRIGMATIKGICFANNKPLAGVSTLDSLAYNLPNVSGIVCPIIDALRNNVYTRLFKYDNGNLSALSDCSVISIDELIENLKEYSCPVHFIGDGITKFKDKLSESLSQVYFAPVHLNFARASALGELGLKLLNSGVFEDLNTCTPIYLRKSQAEREYDQKMELMQNE